MAFKQCDKCGEMVGEAKAFCPGCGNAFVEEEKREKASEFDKLDSTVQLGQTMYNQMLSDMGLNISKSPNPVEKRVEIIAPAAAPAVPRESPVIKVPEKAKPVSNMKWYILGGAVLVLGFLVVVVVAVIAFIYWSRF